MSENLTIEEKVNILCSIAEDIQGKEKIANLLQEKPNFIAYNGFEPSGRMHIAQALITSINTNVITSVGGTMILYIADLFAQLNHKMGGDMNKIHDVGLYFVEVFKACGMDLSKVKFIWSGEFMKDNLREYFETVNNISTFSTLSRIKRTVTIMGRTEGDNLSLSQLLYPCMQAADVFMLNVDICQLGVDQRKVNMLAIEYANYIKKPSPIILSHHMLMGLKGSQNKMSKSDPMSAIFIEDSREDIFKKIHAAYCPLDPKENPLFEYLKYIILRKFNEIKINNKIYNSIIEIENDFLELLKNEESQIQFKNSIAEYIDLLIQPVRNHFQQPELQELLKKVESYRVTR